MDLRSLFSMMVLIFMFASECLITAPRSHMLTACLFRGSFFTAIYTLAPLHLSILSTFCIPKQLHHHSASPTLPLVWAKWKTNGPQFFEYNPHELDCNNVDENFSPQHVRKLWCHGHWSLFDFFFNQREFLLWCSLPEIKFCVDRMEKIVLTRFLVHCIWTKSLLGCMGICVLV